MGIKDFSPNDMMTLRVLNALWRDLHPDRVEKPSGWHPSPAQGRRFSLETIIGLGPQGTEIVRNWLQHTSYSPGESELDNQKDSIRPEDGCLEGRVD